MTLIIDSDGNMTSYYDYEDISEDSYAFRQILRVQNIIESKWMNNIFHLNDFHNSINTVVESSSIGDSPLF